MSVETLNPLATFGINITEAERIKSLSPADRFSEVYQGLMGYKKEVLEDSAVSIPYSYWFGIDGRLYSHPDSHDQLRLFENQIDIRERGGLPIEGFRNLTKTLFTNPNKVIFLYSPPGPVSIDNDPTNPYSAVSPYQNGQLYLQYYEPEKQAVQSFAITVSDESILQTLMPDLYKQAMNVSSYRKYLETYLTSPVVTDINIDDFLSGEWYQGDLSQIVYKHHDGRVSTVFDILAEIRETLSGKEMVVDEHALHLAQELAYSKPTQELVLKMYLKFIHRSIKGNQIQLAGSCGGRIVEKDTIDSLLGITNSFTNIYSTDYRLVTNPLEIKDTSSHYDDYKCPNEDCKKTLSGEPIHGKWRDKCEYCGTSLNC